MEAWRGTAVLLQKWKHSIVWDVFEYCSTTILESMKTWFGKVAVTDSSGLHRAPTSTPLITFRMNRNASKRRSLHFR
ncbi:hypothetical protein AMELA_G00202390 [Ameiurus melas]|uniref:Uncharacterized protein n=1 Tax=Ameiurus melas TaxID=219545 RepID=A0A7J6A467_AMEME|nr:hypothetical protein AMELA_G00202390 [Ameiurus melas]